MGGIGSGRREYGRKRTVDECLAIDLHWMRRQRLLRPGFSGKLTWTNGGRPRGDIRFAAEGDRLLLRFRHRVSGDEWQDTEQPLPIEWTPCRLGGERPWFRCPGVVNGRHCWRRVSKVYAGGRYFLCRHCYGLVYRVQSESELDRHLRRIDKAFEALGGCYCLDEPPPPKPKGMHWRTYRRRAEAIEQRQDEMERAFVARFGFSMF
jgi:hypothetical protein